MTGPITITGVLLDDNTVRLDSPLPHPGYKVRLTVEFETEPACGTCGRVDAFLTELRSMQKARRHYSGEADQAEEIIRHIRHRWVD